MRLKFNVGYQARVEFEVEEEEVVDGGSTELTATVEELVGPVDSIWVNSVDEVKECEDGNTNKQH